MRPKHISCRCPAWLLLQALLLPLLLLPPQALLLRCLLLPLEAALGMVALAMMMQVLLAGLAQRKHSNLPWELLCLRLGWQLLIKGFSTVLALCCQHQLPQE